MTALVDDLKITLDALSAQTETLNSSISEHEEAERMQRLQARIEKDDRYVELAKPGRRLIKEGVLRKWFSRHSLQIASSCMYHFILTDHMLVYAQEKGNKTKTLKVKTSMLIRGMTVEAGSKAGSNADDDSSGSSGSSSSSAGNSNSGSGNCNLLVRAWTHKGEFKEMVLTAASVEERNEWLQAIKGAIAKAATEGEGGRVHEAIQSSSKLAALLGH